MKTNIFKLTIALAGMALITSSCHDDPNVKGSADSATGEAQMSALSIDMSHAEKVINSSGSRATVDLNDFIVKITNADDPSFAARTWTYGDMPEIVTLPVGDNYVVEVESHKIAKAEWERPYYKGSKTFAIENGKITQIGTVTAKFASLKVTVVFNDDIRKVLGDDAKVTITSNDMGELVYTPDETRAGYFEVVEGSTTLVAHFEGTVDGTPTVYDTPFIDIEAGQHRIITYKTKKSPDIPEQSGQVNPGGIEIDADVENVNVDGNVNVDEDILDGSDRPGHEEKPDDGNGDGDGNQGGGDDNQGGDEAPAATFEATDSPSLTLTGVNIASADFGNAKMTIRSEKGIKNLVVTITTDNSSFEQTLEEVGLPMTFDLAYPGDAKDGLDGLGLATGDKVIGQNEVLFDITQFVGLLVPFNGNHNFTLSVTNMENKCETMVLKFKSL